MIELVPLTDVADAAVEALLDRAFEPQRRQRAAYAVRGEARPVTALSFVAMDRGELVGSIQCWPISFVPDAGGRVPLVMVGPVAVAPERQRDGVGRELMARSLLAATAHGCDDGLVLIGDPEYYSRFFGFSADRTGGWRLPGPVEQRRLLARGVRVPDVPGVLGPA
ncbi:MAG: family acetyltransferase [Sphingomonas bacterium]|uniref:GNAT family N-acetyltransferase n=1 Tax=Sphingomonas bacterium TaxID=1895847 RepID=UPI002602E12B|nr:N-acetyltransferase [Sphingomonas bacterium]MDB5696048.1 family acetyltransferase [Sphingomonas bacterium]